MLRLSPFRIQMFRQCKQLYKFFYLDGIKQHYDKPKPPIVMGEHVHRALEGFYKAQVEERTEENVHQMLRKSWVKNRKCFGEKEKEKEWGEKALGMLSSYVQQHDVSKTPTYLEQYVDCTIRPDLVLLGKIDRVDELEDGTLHVIDYKTGKEKQQTPKDTLQLLLYALLVERQYKRKVSRASFWYLATGKSLDISPTQDDLQAAIIEVESVADDLGAEEEYPASPGRLCMYCDFQEICPAFKETIEAQKKDAL